jgi:hypothetical protein
VLVGVIDYNSWPIFFMTDFIEPRERRTIGLDTRGLATYLSGMSKNSSQTERKYWLQIKEKGKNRFIWREMLGSLLFWFVVPPAVELLGGYQQAFSGQFFLIWFLVLPIFLVGGYLTGGWRWKDLEKKYPENSLPPWE